MERDMERQAEWKRLNNENEERKRVHKEKQVEEVPNEDGVWKASNHQSKLVREGAN